MNLSYWEKEYWYETYDFLIVGAGIVGLTTAMELSKTYPEAKIGIIERGVMPSGASTKNAGFACFGTVGEILDDLNGSTEDEVIANIKSRWQGLQRLQSLTSEYDIQYQNNGGEEVFLSEEAYRHCHEKLSYVNDLIHKAIGVSEVIVSKPSSLNNAYSHGLYNSLEAQLNPVLMIKSFIKRLTQVGVDIIYNMNVDDYERRQNIYHIRTNDNKVIRSVNLVFCTNAFTPSLCDVDDIVPARNQVLVTEPIKDLTLRGTYHYNKGYVYFRNVSDDRVLIGGARHMDAEAERTSDFGNHPKIRSYLKEFLSQYVLGTECAIDYEWSGIIATGQSKKPIISKLADGLYVGARLGGMGIAIGSQVGYELSQLIKRTY